MVAILGQTRVSPFRDEIVDEGDCEELAGGVCLSVSHMVSLLRSHFSHFQTSVYQVTDMLKLCV